MSPKAASFLSVLFLALVVSACSTAAQTPQARTPRQLSKIAGWKGAAPNSDDAFTFVVMSDRTGGHVPGKWADAVREVNLLKPDFVICVGDLIEGYTDDEAELIRQWEEFEAITKKLDAPFFYCPGNHDIGWGAIDLKIYLQRYAVDSRSYYSFDYRGCHFVVLDCVTSPPEQFDWLAKDLAAAKNADHVFVFYHYPALVHRPEDRQEHHAGYPGRGDGVVAYHYSAWDNASWSALRKLLPAGKTTIFNGHRHYLTYQLADGIPTYLLAPTGGPVGATGNERREFGDFRMFAHVAVDQGKPTIAMVPLHQVMPGSCAELARRARLLPSSGVQSAGIPAGGGIFGLWQDNPLTVPMTVSVRWQSPGWQVHPQAARFSLEAGAVVKLNDNAKAVTNLSSVELRKVAGKHSREIKKLLGSGRRDVAAIPEDIVLIDY